MDDPRIHPQGAPSDYVDHECADCLRTQLRGASAFLLVSCKLLAQGRSSTVRRGRLYLPDCPRNVVVKVLRMAPSDDVGDLQKQLDVLTQLKHDRILAFWGSYEQAPNQFALVTTYMDFGTMSQYLLERPETRRVPLLIDVAQAVSYLHGKDLVHGEIHAVCHNAESPGLD
ncbi:hypothetical protein AURDEDRAFT_161509 [Auricularia subglabra TFB-10046 SS5]|nr:hypothetical protein AURDEDRAFT_161509 [Auricularia subglabra TFB-10046 SS5]